MVKATLVFGIDGMMNYHTTATRSDTRGTSRSEYEARPLVNAGLNLTSRWKLTNS
jgi:hypothetical protein